MEIFKKSDVEKIVKKVHKNVLFADDGETLWFKYNKGEISWSKYQNELSKSKGHKNNKEYRKHIIEEKRKNNESPKNCMWSREEMIDLYYEQNLTVYQIKKLHNPQVSYATIIRWLYIYRIEKKILLADDSESLYSKYMKGEINWSVYKNEIAKNKGHKNDKEYQKYLIEEKKKKGESPKNCMWTRDELEDLYAYDKQNLSPRQIGKLHDPQVGSDTISRWIDIFVIEKKTQSESNNGKNSGNWQGGISNGPYCEEFTSKVKEYERKRWYRRCVLCNKTEEEEGRKLSVHHVDYNKNQGCDYTQWKLVPLCKSCNTHVNGDRNYYEYLFTNFIMIRKTLEEFDHKIDYKSIGLIYEFN